MPRPISWLPRLHTIRKAVASSVRSHYGRRDLELLFELQPRAAQKLLELLPTTAVGTSRLVEREALAGFLEEVQAAEDVPAVLEQARQQKAAAALRRRLRVFVAKDAEPASLTSLPRALSLSRGRAEVHFCTLEELADAMYFLARLINEDTEGFARDYEPVPEQERGLDGDEVEGLFRELEVAEQTVTPG